ncbi:RNA polymerase factor sigma-54 [Ferriphaselus sp. R-1]|uniref:RNA polymerase factor sigma-54 n=1 Tax=Ferriphaselus sp. R-1 TaxID=1485544 RepID=UPI0005587788|nr:RNA polymerase factor sigma-54 [Ferriphaselus sp. R-1]
MKAALQLRQSQQLTLTPQLQQSIRLLQLSTLEINQETARLLDENPFLECEDDEITSFASTGEGSSVTSSAAPSESETPKAEQDWDDLPRAASSSSSDDDDDYHPETAASSPSLREHLLTQLSLSQLDHHDRQLIALLIDALDDSGFLTQSLEEIHDLLPEALDVSLDDLETALVQLQHLDEPGIAARDLAECLSLQLRALPDDQPGRQLALRLAAQHLDLLAAHDYMRLKRHLHCSDDELRVAQALILQLDPRPASRYDQRVSDYVVPDVIVERQRGRWTVRLNPEAMPRLRVNQLYANLMQGRDEQSSPQMAGQLQEARWYIKNMQQRFDTIQRVARAIVERQRMFFEHGEVAMRPLVLREIAEELELHESTISRVTTQKFMLTPRGIFEFKYFFGSGVSTDSGGACSATAIRALIKQLISQEDPHHPLSDSGLAEILVSQGIQVARRTVAKYRESLNILPVNLRKSL